MRAITAAIKAALSIESLSSPPNRSIASSPLWRHIYTSSSASTNINSTTTRTADYSNLIPKLVVFGGSGFVGTHVCQQALKLGGDVISVSRSGRPSWLTPSSHPWADSVQWVQGDALDPEQQGWGDVLAGATGVVSTLGTFGTNTEMYTVCGLANMKLMDVAVAAGIPRFSFISVHDYQFPGGWHTKDFLLKGYFQGKREAEIHLAKTFPDGGVAIRPGMIYGTRHAGRMTVPLQLIGAPLAAALKLLPTQSLAEMPIIGAAFVPPVSVTAVGRAAATAVLDDSVPPGIMDVWTIASKYASSSSS